MKVLKDSLKNFAFQNANLKIPSILVSKEKITTIFDSKNKIFLGKTHEHFTPEKIDGLREGLKKYLETLLPDLNSEKVDHLKKLIKDEELINFLNDNINLNKYFE